MPAMQVLITGTGDAFSRLRYGTSAVLAAPGGFVMIDCPDPLHRLLHEGASRGGGPFAALQSEDIGDILLTHLHGDHSNGLESLGFFRRIRRLRGLEQALPRLWCARETADRLWHKLAPAMAGGLGRTLADFYDLRILTPGETHEVAGLRVECRVTTHPLHCLGFRIRHPDGAMLGWSGDSAYEPAHLEWLSAADTIVHEAGGPAPAHTEAAQLAALPEPLRNKLRVLHIPDGWDSAGLAHLSDGELLRVRK